MAGRVTQSECSRTSGPLNVSLSQKHDMRSGDVYVSTAVVSNYFWDTFYIEIPHGAPPNLNINK